MLSNPDPNFQCSAVTPSSVFVSSSVVTPSAAIQSSEHAASSATTPSSVTVPSQSPLQSSTPVTSHSSLQSSSQVPSHSPVISNSAVQSSKGVGVFQQSTAHKRSNVYQNSSAYKSLAAHDTNDAQEFMDEVSLKDKYALGQARVKVGLDKLRFGVAYYREYMHTERLQEDIRLMQQAGINTVRIGESTWSTYEKQDGIFDFSPLITVLDAMYQANIQVIIGTPTYAVPAWLVRKYPQIMVTTPAGQTRYGPRQQMDITHPAYLFYAERIIRRMMEAVSHHPAVIGYQIDNETKYYETCSDNVQHGFVQSLKTEFAGDLDKLNDAFGLDYWSNRINSWEEFPDVVNTINGSLASAFKRYQRSLVTNFLQWQRNIVEEYALPEQFVTHNFDFEWRQYSFGMQPAVDHFAAAQCLDIAGVDIYHPGQHELTGREIGYGGDWTYALKHQPYFILETEAQGFKNWTPLPGQLYLQGLLHLAHGARMISYWHWHSIHNSFETYWKGLLSHDLCPNAVYEEACSLGRALSTCSDLLRGFDKRPYTKVCLLVSNDALTAVDYFPFEGHQFIRTEHHQYNDLVRRYYDALHDANIQVDICDVKSDWSDRGYELIVVPMLYAASDETLDKLVSYVKAGGNVLASFRSGMCNEHIQVRAQTQPSRLSALLGFKYQLIAQPQAYPNLLTTSDTGSDTYTAEQIGSLYAHKSNWVQPTISWQDTHISSQLTDSDCQISDYMELLEVNSERSQSANTACVEKTVENTSTTAKAQSEIWAKYTDPSYDPYAAIVFNEGAQTGQGSICYIGCHVTSKVISTVIHAIEQRRHLKLATCSTVWPCLYYRARNEQGQEIGFIFNVSSCPVKFTLPETFTDVLTHKQWSKDSTVVLQPWAAHVGVIAK